MEICDSIFNSLESKTIARNDVIYAMFLDEFVRESGLSFNFIKKNDSFENKVIGIQNEFLYDSDYVDLFFKIMRKYGYYMRQDIKDLMCKLGNLKYPNDNSDLIRKYLNSPVIDDVSFDGVSKFTIFSERYGKFIFELASYFFRENDRMASYIKSHKLPNDCHNHTYFMAGVLPTYYSVTSLCTYYFRGRYFHSYAYDKERDLIVDLCSNAVMNKTDYYSLYNPREVSVVLNMDVRDERKIAESKTQQPYSRCYLLKIALYKIFLDYINYEGSLEDAPSTYSYSKKR